MPERVLEPAVGKLLETIRREGWAQRVAAEALEARAIRGSDDRAIVDPGMTAADADRYWAEMTRIPTALGCTVERLPAGRIASSVADASEDLARYRPQLCRSARTDTVVELLYQLPVNPGMGALRDLIVQCGIQLLPGWALDELGIARASTARRNAMLGALRVSVRPVRWALRGGIAGHARLRMQDRG